jgi:hypothetical protein
MTCEVHGDANVIDLPSGSHGWEQRCVLSRDRDYWKLIEDAGTGDLNPVIYAADERFRINGGGTW